jgi:hypothetical protein
MTVALDFDGVIHGYSHGWQGGDIYDPPVPGAIEALRSLLGREPVFILTARTNRFAVVSWLVGHGVPATWFVNDANAGLFWESRTEVLVTNRKLPARLYVDDRALLFTDWPTTVSRINAQPVHGPVVDPVAAIETRLRAIHVKNEMGFCAVCVGPYDPYDRQYPPFLWPCPTLQALTTSEDT